MDDDVPQESFSAPSDVLVIGAGMGGLYAVHRFASDGLSVVGLEAAEGGGGVWLPQRISGCTR